MLNTLKLDQLIPQFLYQTKRLSLPGIGTFTTDGSAVQFDNKSDVQVSNDLVEFVKTHTGKMHSLALSDLESYIMLNKQFLNIGKALYIEGIGTLVKSREGSYEFTPGVMVTERLEEIPVENRKQSVFTDDARYAPQSGDTRKWMIGLGVLLTLAIVVWGGWRLSQNTSGDEEMQQVALPADSIPARTDTSAANRYDSLRRATIDSLPASGAVQGGSTVPSYTGAANNWKFVIEQTPNKNRALKRFNQLKEIGKDIRLETTDSTSFKLYFILPATPADTTRMKDSLRRFYLSRRVSVEQ